MMKKRSILMCAGLALALFAALLPWRISGAWSYDAGDVEKLRTFLEQTDADGVKNGTKLNPDYTPDDPSTWTGEHEQGNPYSLGVTWNESGRAVAFNVEYGSMSGALDFSGMDAIEYVYIAGASVPTANFALCTALEEIFIYMPDEVPLTGIDLSDTPSLRRIHLNYNALTSLDLSGCPQLTVLCIEGNDITELDLSHNGNLELIMCEGNKLRELDLSANSALKELHCNRNELTYLDVSNCESLRNLQFNYNRIKSIDLSNVPELTALGCAGNGMNTLDVAGCPEIWMIECQDNELTNLDFSAVPNIQDIFCYNNELTELRVPENSNVQMLICRNNRLTSLDLENMQELFILDGSNNLFESIELINYGNDVGDTVGLGCVRLLDGPMKRFRISNYSADVELTTTGGGTIGVYSRIGDDYYNGEPIDDDNGIPWDQISGYVFIASANEGETFLGWYDENGALVSDEIELKVENGEYKLQARFTETASTPEPTAEPTPTAEPGQSDTPNPPETGGVSLYIAGAAAMCAGMTAVLLRRKEG